MPRIYDTPRTFKSSTPFPPDRSTNHFDGKSSSFPPSCSSPHNIVLRLDDLKTRVEIILFEKKVEKSGEKCRIRGADPIGTIG